MRKQRSDVEAEDQSGSKSRKIGLSQGCHSVKPVEIPRVLV